MGRLTLNVLLSFAQFEREVTAERIRDKIAASRKKGMWMGGPPPLGYDVRDKKLVVNAAEAQQVRKLFAAYLEVGSVKDLTAWAAQQGILTKVRTRSDGRTRSGGRPFSRGNIHALLRYRTYIGEVQHRGNVYPGEQEAIIDKDVWDRVQEQLQRGDTTPRGGRPALATISLAGLLFDDTGDRLTPTHASKKGRRYPYYVSTRLIEKDAGDPTGWRLPAHKLEQAVCSCVTEFLGDKTAVLDAIGETDTLATMQINQIIRNVDQLTDKIAQMHPSKQLSMIRPLLHEVIVGNSQLQITVSLKAVIVKEAEALKADISGPSAPRNSSKANHAIEGKHLHTIVSAFAIQRRGVEAHLIIGNGKTGTTNLDANLMQLLAKARIWVGELRSGAASVNAIAERENLPASEVSRRLPLAFLAPSIVSAILRGEQPGSITATRLLRVRDLPLNWTDQASVLGFSAP